MADQDLSITPPSIAKSSTIDTFSKRLVCSSDSVESLTQATQAVIGELAYTRTMLLSHSHRFTAV
ncbi:hypothetical protein SAMN04490189_3757 [Pseudomonas koreensis]|uniref:hypothetical protein n=1 Tax=Pseudomonas koreensis TaxID=198620 RepID=UPI00087CE965|nr:hypothetical protein [Pseudomonas koreensis]KAB0515380.1 hypothetical protein F7R05_06930 [Pseudomonas koreensis]NNA61055.1 hypothetical protein [Pseudomonas koreensis]GGK26129.1 hypothetical protein GCM10009103_21800 [Pseudomonas koreensis]SDD92714.1 hypothetical protein SAMN04490189_3757 [Pseudomonas koreensis]